MRWVERLIEAGSPAAGGARRPFIGRRGWSGILIALAGLAAPAAAQEAGTVIGEVIDGRTLRPLVGAQVAAPGTDRGTLTDGRGRFLLVGLSGDSVRLQITHVGYRALERTVPVGSTNLRFAMEASAIALDELVVTGTAGATQRRALGNAIAKFDAPGIIEAAPITSVSELLSARAPGVVLQAQQGTAGGGSRILIRGRGSMQFGGNPLVYVDGVRVNSDPTTGPYTPEAGAPTVLSRLDDLDPNDIESIEIIKGPAAATLYGTEASAGVIQIITKKGRAGNTRFGLRVRQGTSWLPDQDEVVGVKWARDEATGEIFQFSPLEVLRASGTEYFRAGHIQGYGFDVRGGAETIQYYVSATWDREEGIVPSNTAEKFRGRANLTFQPRSDLNVNTSVGLVTGRADTYHYLYFFSGRYALPALRDAPSRGFTGLPPDVQVKTQEIYQDIDRFTGSVQLDHYPREWFRQRLTVGLDMTKEEDVWLIPFVPDEYANVYSPSARLGSKSVNAQASDFSTVDYSGSVSLPLSDRIHSNTSVGLQYYRRFTKTHNLAGQEFPVPGVTVIGGITGQRQAGEDFVENSSVGLFLQQQFAWQNRLFLTGAIRGDDHSAFGANFDLVTYPKVSASWVISDESFWNVPVLSSLKLRTAYGESGQQPAAFAAIRTYAPISGAGDRPAGTPVFVGNPDLGPERGREIEAGFEADLFGGRSGVDFTYYHQRTDDAIVSRNVAPSTGYPTSQFVNAGTVENKGFELLLTGRPIATRDLSWDLAFNFSKNTNEVLSLNVPGVEFIGTGFIPNRHQPGYPVASYFGKRILSADLDANGRAVNVLCDAGDGTPVACGQAPEVFLGQNVPDTEGSVTSTLTLFDRVRLNAMLDFKRGRSYFSSDKALLCAVFRTHEINFYPERFDPRDVAYCQNVAGTGFFADGFILGADFAKLRELSLNYVVPTRWAAALGASRASITFGARNLFTWHDDDPFQTTDPEVFTAGNFASSNHNQGIVPMPRQFMTTIDITF